MGKVTGFMEFERLEEGYKPVPERLKNYKEFVIGLDDKQAKTQAARCISMFGKTAIFRIWDTRGLSTRSAWRRRRDGLLQKTRG